MGMIEEHQDIIHKISGLYADNEEDRRDLDQEIVCQLWKASASFRGECKISTWMYRVSLNTALLNLRHKKRRPQMQQLTEHHDNVTAGTDDQEQKDEIRRLYAAIQQLREFDRAIILLYLEQLAYREIGEILGISAGNVSVRLVRVKQTLRELLGRGLKNER